MKRNSFIVLAEGENEGMGNKRKLHRSSSNHIRIAESLQAPKLWKMGHRGRFQKTIISSSTIHSGAGIHVAVFDTGIQDGHPHFPNIAEVTNWTDEKNDHDSMKEIGSPFDSISIFFSDWSWFICCWCYW